MRKLTLDIDTLNVQSFETSRPEAGQGTVFGHAPTNGRNTGCLSAVDACPTRFGCETSFELCTDPSAVDACPSGRGCTEFDGCLGESALDECATGFCVPA